MKKILNIIILSMILMLVLQLKVLAMPIYVENKGGDIIGLEVEPGDSIYNIKTKIKDKKGIHIDKQTLTFNNKELADEHTLADYNIQKNSKLNLSVKTIVINISGLLNTTKKYTGKQIELNGKLTTNPSGYEENITVSYNGIEGTTYSSSKPPTNVGKYKVTYNVSDKINYSVDSKTNTYTLVIEKIDDPNYSLPNGLSGIKGNKLSTVKLPNGFTWNNPYTIIIDGNNSYKAKYEPSNKNYKTKENISIKVFGQKTFNLTTSVDGENGTISPSENNILEGTSKKIIIIPDEGYKIKNITINEKDMTSNVINGELELIMNEDYNVVVVFKEIYSYTVISGDNTTYSNDKIVIKLDAPYNKFVSVSINNKELDSKSYTIEEGSTILTISNDYLKTLKYGKYEIKVTYQSDRIIKVNFEINKETNIFIYISLMVVIILALCIMVLKIKKKSKSNNTEAKKNKFK